MSAAPQEFSRTEERMRRHARTVRGAFVLAAALHLAGAVAANPSLILRLFLPRTLLGYPGSSRPGDVAPEGVPGRPGGVVFRSRRPPGPTTLIPLEVTPPEPGAASAHQAAPQARSGAYEPSANPPGTAGVPGGRGFGVHFELDENGVVIGGSGGSATVARSEKFQTLKIVRPEYPKAAIRAGLEGLVRLEVQVDTAGKVVAVRTDLNATRSSEMEEAASRAMRLWEFKPYEEKNRPIPFTLIVPFRYRLVD